MSSKVKIFLYWVSILPPIYKAIRNVCSYVYRTYMNTLIEIEQQKQEDAFEKACQYDERSQNDN